MVPGAGLEPARPFERGILNPLCLPISPPGQSCVALKSAGRTARIIMNAGRLCKYFIYHSIDDGTRGVVNSRLNRAQRSVWSSVCSI